MTERIRGGTKGLMIGLPMGLAAHVAIYLFGRDLLSLIWRWL